MECGEHGERGERCDWWPRRVVVWIVDTHDQNVVFHVLTDEGFINPAWCGGGNGGRH